MCDFQSTFRVRMNMGLKKLKKCEKTGVQVSAVIFHCDQ